MATKKTDTITTAKTTTKATKKAAPAETTAFPAADDITETTATPAADDITETTATPAADDITETTAPPAADATVEAVKAKVLRTYRDKESQSIQKTGTVVELSEARFKELSKLGYVRKA